MNKLDNGQTPALAMPCRPEGRLTLRQFLRLVRDNTLATYSPEAFEEDIIAHRLLWRQPQFPQRFGCIQDAKTFCRSFFDWYNQDHHHAGIGLMTPDQVHYGQADAIHAARQNTLDGAFNRTPERFVRKDPKPPAKPIATWINPPQKTLNIQA